VPSSTTLCHEILGQAREAVSYNFGILHNYRKHHYDHESITAIEIVLAANLPQAKQSLPLFY
jgi:hypothetical protein